MAPERVKYSASDKPIRSLLLCCWTDLHAIMFREKNPDDKLNRHICIVFGLPSEFFSRDVLTHRFVQQRSRRLWKGLSEVEYFTLPGAIFEFFLECFDFKQI